MHNIKVKIKKTNPKAVIPCYAKAGDAGLNLTATSISYDEYGNICYGTGLAFEIPEGYVGLIFPRSSICKEQLLLSNAVGVIDSGYRGEVSFKFKPSMALDENQCVKTDKDRLWSVAIRQNNIYGVGDRIGQMIIMPYPQIEFEEVEELSETERGEGGYGSSGK
jgi:dUTP pyrophosphatase